MGFRSSGKDIYEWGSRLVVRETISTETGYTSRIWGVLISIESSHHGEHELSPLITPEDAKRYIQELETARFDPDDKDFYEEDITESNSPAPQG